MTTPTWITGFEYGLAALSTNGGGLANVQSGTMSIQNTIKHSGDYALRVNPTAATARLAKTVLGSSDTVVFKFHIYFTTLPDVQTEIAYQNVAGAITFKIFYVPSGTRLSAAVGAGGLQPGPSITTDTWYRVDYRAYVGAATWTLDWYVEDNAQTQATEGGHSATDFNAQNTGIGASTACTMDAYFDDIYRSETSGDYPIGASEVLGLRPDSDGTHNNASNIMEDIDGNDIDGSSFFAYDKLDEAPWGTAAASDYVRQTGNGTANYCEVNFTDTSETTILGAMAILQYASASATANNGGCVIIDEDATSTTLWGAIGALADYSESSAFYKSVILPAPAGGWDAAAVNAIKSRFGYSGDANPDPYWLAMILEVAYVPVSGTPATVTAVVGTATAAGIAPALAAASSISGTVAIAQAAMLAPSIGFGTSVTIVAATANAAGIVPAITSGGSVAGVAGTAIAAGVAPALSSQASVTAVAGTANAAGIAPMVSATIDANVNAVVATADAAGVAPGIEGILIDIDHEIGDLTEYTTTVTDAGDLSVTVGAALAGTNYGLRCFIDDINAIYGSKTVSASTSGKLRFRFYVNPNSLSMEDGDTIAISISYSNANAIAAIFLYYTTALGYQILYGLYDDLGTFQYTTATITNAEHGIEGYLQRAATSGSNDGSLNLWIDDVEKTAVTGQDNYDRFSDFVQISLGVVVETSTGISGEFYLDELIVNNDGSEIGLKAGDGNVVGVVATATAAGIIPVISASISIAAAAGTATAAGIVPAVSGAAGITAVVTVASATGVAPAISAQAALTAVAATASAAAIAPQVSASGDASVVAVTGTADAAGIVPALSAVANITAFVATASAELIAPQVVGSGSGDGSVTAVTATSTAAGIAPALTAQASITLIVAAATGAGIAPVLSSGVSVTGIAAEANAAGITPALSSGSSITGTAATATAAMVAPAVTGGGSGDATVTAVVIVALAAMVAPAVANTPSVGIRKVDRLTVIAYRGSHNVIESRRIYKRK